jgi:GH24 family phage-related lysozyme (muramidase)
MRASPALLEYLKRRERLRLRRYRDQAGKWTIGYGHLIRPHELATLKLITEDQAEALLLADVGAFAVYLDGVSRNFAQPLSQTQFDGVLSFAFNVGLRALEQSTLLKLLRVGDFAGAAAQFGRWIYVTVTRIKVVDGKEVPVKVKEVSNGLVNRRRMDQAIFERAVYA